MSVAASSSNGYNYMNFEQFQQNVQAWAAARGIYEHSTPLAQALKAVSEVGELADAVIKGDREALKDAIGDVAVCLVNLDAMCRGSEADREWSGHRFNYLNLQHGASVVVQQVAECLDVAEEGSSIRPWTGVAISSLMALAVFAGMTFDECCQAAWDEIKDRTGRMVAGGAFVKDEQV